MNHTTIGILIILTSLLVGCTQLIGSGNVVTLEETIADFDKVDVEQGFEVHICQGEAFSVVLRVDDNIVEHLQVVKQGNTLKIGLQPGRAYNIHNATMAADVTMPELTRLDLRSGSDVTISGFRSAQALTADLASGSHLRGDVEAGDSTFDLASGSHVTLIGSAGALTINAREGSHALLGDLAVADANVTARSGSHATVSPSGRLDCVARSGSHVKYLGSPTMGTIETDDGSSVARQ